MEAERMKAFLIIAIATIILGAVFPRPVSAQQTLTPAKHESPFACDRLALTPELRKRHFDELGPKLHSLTTGVRELPNGYEFEFPTESAIIQDVAEWAAGERLCCPFFDIDMRVGSEGGPFVLRLTGREGVKRFIKSDLARWFKG